MRRRQAHTKQNAAAHGQDQREQQVPAGQADQQGGELHGQACLVHNADDNACGRTGDGNGDYFFSAGLQSVQYLCQRDTFAFLHKDQADQDQGGNRIDRRERRGILLYAQRPDQDGDRHNEREAGQERGLDRGEILGGSAPEAELARLEMHLSSTAEEIQDSRENCRNTN